MTVDKFVQKLANGIDDGMYWEDVALNLESQYPDINFDDVEERFEDVYGCHPSEWAVE